MRHIPEPCFNHSTIRSLSLSREFEEQLCEMAFVRTDPTSSPDTPLTQREISYLNHDKDDASFIHSISLSSLDATIPPPSLHLCDYRSHR
jgi:hypothetical protein